MAKQTRSTRGRKAKAKTMKRRKANAKTMKKPQRRTRLGLMKRKRFTRKVKRGGQGERARERERERKTGQVRRAENRRNGIKERDIDAIINSEDKERKEREKERERERLFMDKIDLAVRQHNNTNFIESCKNDTGYCKNLIDEIKKHIQITYPNTYISNYLLLNNTDDAIKKFIYDLSGNDLQVNQASIKTIVEQLINNTILTNYINEFQENEAVTAYNAAKNVFNDNMAFYNARFDDFHEDMNAPIRDFDEYDDNETVLQNLNRSKRILLTQIKTVKINNDTQPILTDKEKPPTQENSAQEKENSAQELVEYDIATDNDPNVGYVVVGDDEDNEDEE
jgi:hypothetical protein